jgi:hypothetical protein
MTNVTVRTPINVGIISSRRLAMYLSN